MVGEVRLTHEEKPGRGSERFLRHSWLARDNRRRDFYIEDRRTRRGFSLSANMFKYAVGVLLMCGACLCEPACPGNSTCPPCSPPDCPANTTQPVIQPRTECANLTCALPPSGEERNATEEKPLSTTTKFSPSPFLGLVPERSVVVGEVFHENLGVPGLSTSRQAAVREYAVAGGEPFRPRPPPHAVEIQIGGSGYGSDYHRPPGRPDIEIRPLAGYGGKTEIEIRPHAGFSGLKEVEVSSKPLGAYSEGLKTSYGRPANDQLSHVRPARPGGERTAQHRDYGKPYDPGNAAEYAGYPDTRPSQPYYEGYENMKNLLKPSKGSGPYFFEDNFQEKPIQEITGDDPHKTPFPPAGPSAGGGDSFKHIEQKGGGKWKTLLKFLTTVLPIGLLFAALTPNVLVVSPSEEPSTGKGSLRPPAGTIKRSLEAPVGPCGLRRLCQALSESPADFDQFLKAASQGSTSELREIIRKAEEKDCDSIGCGQYQVLKPTQPSYR